MISLSDGSWSPGEKRPPWIISSIRDRHLLVELAAADRPVRGPPVSIA